MVEGDCVWQSRPDKWDITACVMLPVWLSGVIPKRNCNFRTVSNDIREQDCSRISESASLENGRTHSAFWSEVGPPFICGKQSPFWWRGGGAIAYHCWCWEQTPAQHWQAIHCQTEAIRSLSFVGGYRVPACHRLSHPTATAPKPPHMWTDNRGSSMCIIQRLSVSELKDHVFRTNAGGVVR